jgi:hypothetical protein
MLEPLIAPVTPHSSTPQMKAARTASRVPLPELSIAPIPARWQYAISHVDASGRLTDKSTLRLLGWEPGERCTMAAQANRAMVIRRDPDGLATQDRNVGLSLQLDQTRLPTKADRNRALLGHVKTTMPANPLAPRVQPRRHPKMLPDGARPALLEAANTARDRMVITWFYDGGFRIGELCGLRLADLHLRDNSECAECRTPHAHICHRHDNLNAARAKAKQPWELANGVVHGGLVRRVSSAMIFPVKSAC